MKPKITFLPKFRRIFDQYEEHDGKRFDVLECGKPVDTEVIGMLRIRLEDGSVITAHPEETVATVNGEKFRVFVGGVEK